MLELEVAPHPLLQLAAFVARFPAPLGHTPSPPWLTDLLRLEAQLHAPDGTRLVSDEAVRGAVRKLLRHGGYKPSGRGKPASEYLAAALAKREFPRINALVDACNVVSLHSGLPISLVDLDRLDRSAPLAIRIAPPATTYVFNPSGQTIDASGLVCLHDAQGPTATPIKDAQRTKTHGATVAALVVLWGTRALPGRTAEATRWYRALVPAITDATVEDVTLA